MCPDDPINDPDGDGVCDIDEIYGCTDLVACNYNALATEEDFSCEYAIDLYQSGLYDCDGDCINDIDGDGICGYDDDCPADSLNDIDGVRFMKHFKIAYRFASDSGQIHMN